MIGQTEILSNSFTMLRTEHNKLFIGRNGNKINYQHWPSEQRNDASSTSVIIFFHSKKEMSQIVLNLIEKLNLPSYHFFSLEIDQHDLMENKPSNTPCISRFVEDIHYFIEHLKLHYSFQEQNMAVLAGGAHAVIMASWITDYVPNIRAVVLLAPLFYFKTHHKALLLAKEIAYQINKRSITKFIKHSMPTDLGIIDHFIEQHYSQRFLYDLFYTGKRILRNAFSWFVPTQLFLSTNEHFFHMPSQIEFYTQIATHKKVLDILPSYPYPASSTQQNDDVINRIRYFLVDCFNQMTITPSLFDSYKQGPTKAEYDRLNRPEPDFLKRCYWSVNRFALKHIGKYATGIRIGLETGFDSGASMDHIYKNQASGSHYLGKMLDRYYLNNPGLHCTRLREKNVESVIIETINRLSQEHKSIRILDVAAGHGLYIFNSIKSIDYPIEHILMRDYVASNVENGNQRLKKEKLDNIAIFEQGDAFSADDLALLPKDRTLTIVSGLYELFSDNRMVLISLKGIANATELGGYIIYTTKLWNPELEYMARVLPSHNQGKPWLLRRRTQLEIDQLVTSVGFKKITQRIDPWGIFSVSLAQKQMQ